MADYDHWDRACCGTFMGPHKDWCKNHPDVTLHQLARSVGGFTYDNQLKLFRCRRGCGCVVWDIAAHADVVCRKWES
jgi:hypothetical protein